MTDLFVAVTRDGGFYATKSEDEAADMASFFDIDANQWPFNIFVVQEEEVFFTGIDYIKEVKNSWRIE